MKFIAIQAEFGIRRRGSVMKLKVDMELRIKEMKEPKSHSLGVSRDRITRKDEPEEKKLKYWVNLLPSNPIPELIYAFLWTEF